MPSLASTEAPTRADFPQPAPKKPLGVILGVALGVVALGAAALALRPSSTDTAGAQALTSAGPPLASSVPASTSTTAPPRPVLKLHSIPEGARVSDGERDLGTTPLEIPLDGVQGRKLSLLLDGYEPFSLASLPSESTRIDVPLKAAEKIPRGNGSPPRSGKVPAPPKTTATVTEPPPPPPPAIRMTR
jgi:hypothetical protein